MRMKRPIKAKKIPSTCPAPSRVLIIDDHPLTRHGLARLIELEADLAVCGEAENPAQGLAAVHALKPQVVVTDLSMPGGVGLELIKDIRAQHPEIGILVVSMHDETIFAERVLRAGARGYIMKNEGGAKVVEAIRRVLQGKTYVSENMSARIVDLYSGRRYSSVLGKLTDREFEVFNLLGQGLTTREIGRQLRLSGKTVETHRLHIREKLQIASGPALIQHAVRWAGAQQLI
jgi:DNA-binding NarL/FixJ family response regulator